MLLFTYKHASSLFCSVFHPHTFYDLGMTFNQTCIIEGFLLLLLLNFYRHPKIKTILIIIGTNKFFLMDLKKDNV